MAYSSMMTLGTPTTASTISSTHFRRSVPIPSSTLSVIFTTLPNQILMKRCDLRCHRTALFSAIGGGGAVPRDAAATALVLADAYAFVSTSNDVTPRKIKEKGIHLSRTQIIVAKAVSGSAPSTENQTSKMDEKSETYSQDMTAAMGAVLTYRHELGMNYNFIQPDLIVGSCLQTPEDVDKLRSIGVKTIFCLQQDSDLEYFGVDIAAIREYANKCGDIQHLRAEIRDFDAFDLRMRLPAVVSKLHKAISQNGGVTYIHCTAGLGRAPATALAYMFWVQGYNLSEAHELLMSKRPCFPKLDAIKSATADILTGMIKKPVIFTWYGDDCSTVELSGLDIGWGQRIPLTFNEERGLWNLHRELPEGRYEYKYIVDGKWMCNDYEPLTSPNKDGHVNNYVEVFDDNPNSVSAVIRNRLSSDDPNLSTNECLIIRQFLEAYPDED